MPYRLNASELVDAYANDDARELHMVESESASRRKRVAISLVAILFVVLLGSAATWWLTPVRPHAEAWPSRQTLIVADDMPARWRDVFGYIAHLSGTEMPKPGGRIGFPSFRMSNRRARQTLRWTPRYADYRSSLVR